MHARFYTHIRIEMRARTLKRTKIHSHRDAHMLTLARARACVCVCVCVYVAYIIKNITLTLSTPCD